MGRYDLGLPSDEIWRLTPAQYHALYQRWLYNRRIDDYFTARLMALLEEMFRDKEAHPEPIKVADAMLFKPPKKLGSAGGGEPDWKVQKDKFRLYTDVLEAIRLDRVAKSSEVKKKWPDSPDQA